MSEDLRPRNLVAVGKAWPDLGGNGNYLKHMKQTNKRIQNEGDTWEDGDEVAWDSEARWNVSFLPAGRAPWGRRPKTTRPRAGGQTLEFISDSAGINQDRHLASGPEKKPGAEQLPASVIKIVFKLCPCVRDETKKTQLVLHFTAENLGPPCCWKHNTSSQHAGAHRSTSGHKRGPGSAQVPGIKTRTPHITEWTPEAH